MFHFALGGVHSQDLLAEVETHQDAKALTTTPPDAYSYEYVLLQIQEVHKSAIKFCMEQRTGFQEGDYAVHQQE
jgi:hypothetical protein